jgi:hypothetical protein
MRYAKDSLVISPERDIPLLRQVRNSKFVSHRQLFELMSYRGSEHSADSFNWRIRRLLKAGCLALCNGVFGAGSAVYQITREGMTLLEHHGQFTTVLHSNTAHLPHLSQIFHSLELNRIQLALTKENLLAHWQSEVEIASLNTISRSPYQKDYDAIVDVWIGDRRARFALEYERSLKSARQYERIRAALSRERQIGCFLYLTAGIEVLVHLVHEFENVPPQIAFATAGDFGKGLLDTHVITSRRQAGTSFKELLR